MESRSIAVAAVASVGVDEQVQKNKRFKTPSGAGIGSALMVTLGVGLGGAGAYIADGAPLIMLMLLLLGGGLVLIGALLWTNTRRYAPQPRAPRFSVRISTVDGEKCRIDGLDRRTARHLADTISGANAKK